MNRFSLWKIACMVFFWAATGTISNAQDVLVNFKTLASFDGTNGANPEYMSLVQGTDGSFYGTTSAGGADGQGTVFKITPGGKLTTIYSFCKLGFPNCADGAYPTAELVQGTDGNFYGTTALGGGTGCSGYGCGTVFKITAGGKLTTLHTFNGADGYDPLSGLVQGANGSFYGTTCEGKANDYGTVFRIHSNGAFMTMHRFDAADGAYPVSALVQAGDGNFYGTTSAGGANSGGTVFKITPGGKLTSIYSFCKLGRPNCADGAEPYGRLVQGTDGNFYGTTWSGGKECSGACGTVFKISGGGKLTALHSFDGTDGANPLDGLVNATDGNFYGTTNLGGANTNGTVFKITPEGKLTSLYSFCSQTGCPDGSSPFGGLLQGTNGDFYGATYYGGASNSCLDGCGTVFRLSMGLGAFVEIPHRARSERR